MTRYRIHVRLPVRVTVGLTLPRFAFVVRKGRGVGTVRLTVRLTVGLTLPRGVYNLWWVYNLCVFSIFCQISSFI